MADSHEINEHDEVVPYSNGRRCTDTRAWRDATELELQQRDEIESLGTRLLRAEELLRQARQFALDVENGAFDREQVAESTREAINAFLGDHHDD